MGFCSVMRGNEMYKKKLQAIVDFINVLGNPDGASFLRKNWSSTEHPTSQIMQTDGLRVELRDDFKSFSLLKKMMGRYRRCLSCGGVILVNVRVCRCGNVPDVDTSNSEGKTPKGPNLDVQPQEAQRLKIPGEAIWALMHCVKTGKINVHWPFLRLVVSLTIEEVFSSFFALLPDDTVELDWTPARSHLCMWILRLERPPSTIQRICEILLDSPYQHHEKLFFSLQKLICNRAIVSEYEELPLSFDFSSVFGLNEALEICKCWSNLGSSHYPVFSIETINLNGIIAHSSGVWSVKKSPEASNRQVKKSLQKGRKKCTKLRTRSRRFHLKWAALQRHYHC